MGQKAIMFVVLRVKTVLSHTCETNIGYLGTRLKVPCSIMLYLDKSLEFKFTVTCYKSVIFESSKVNNMLKSTSQF